MPAKNRQNHHHHPNNPVSDNPSGNDLQEDEYGYVEPVDSVSTHLLSQLPSRHLDKIITDNPRNQPISTLKRRNSKYRTMQLKNATLNTRKGVTADKIYEILSSDDVKDDQMKTLREMHQSLTIKRQVKHRLDADEKKNTRSLGCGERLRMAIANTWNHMCLELRATWSALEPWHSSIKAIRGQHGSVVAAYFVFLRWLLYINVVNCVLAFCFVIGPHVFYAKDELNATRFHVADLITGSGWMSRTIMYFGSYSSKKEPYNMPLAYLLTIAANSLINLIAVSTSISSSYQRNYVDTAGEIKHVFCNKIFSAWDYATETQSAAQLQKRAFANGIKELLYLKSEGQRRQTKTQQLVQKIFLLVVSVFSLIAISAVGYLVYFLLEAKALKVDIAILENLTLSLTVTFISSASYFILKYASSFEIFLSRKMKLFLTMIRVVALRIVMLGIIAYFWMVIYKPPRDEDVCYETELGTEVYRLLLVQFVVSTLIFNLGAWACRRLLRRPRPQFDVAFHTLDLLQYQTLAWVGCFCFPLSPLLIIVFLVAIFYLQKFSLLHNCRPPERPACSRHELHAFFLLLTGAAFFFAAFTVGYSMLGTDPSACGPFREYTNTADVLRHAISSTLLEQLTQPAVLFGVAVGLGLILYYMRAKARAHISLIKKIREQLILASKDKVFLLKLFEEAMKAKQETSRTAISPTSSSISSARVSQDNINGSPFPVHQHGFRHVLDGNASP